MQHSSEKYAQRGDLEFSVRENNQRLYTYIQLISMMSGIFEIFLHNI